MFIPIRQRHGGDTCGSRDACAYRRARREVERGAMTCTRRSLHGEEQMCPDSLVALVVLMRSAHPDRGSHRDLNYHDVAVLSRQLCKHHTLILRNGRRILFVDSAPRPCRSLSRPLLSYTLPKGT